MKIAVAVVVDPGAQVAFDIRMHLDPRDASRKEHVGLNLSVFIPVVGQVDAVFVACRQDRAENVLAEMIVVAPRVERRLAILFGVHVATQVDVGHQLVDRSAVPRIVRNRGAVIETVAFGQVAQIDQDVVGQKIGGQHLSRFQRFEPQRASLGAAPVSRGDSRSGASKFPRGRRMDGTHPRRSVSADSLGHTGELP